MNIRKLIIEDVRCFAGRHEFDIRPLTFLVGENSTGKSTILGCFDTLFRFAMARDRSTKREGMDFNAAPYQMGVFADIVRKPAPKEKSFKLGYEFQSESRNENIEYEYVLTLSEKEKGSEPVVREQKLSSRDNEFIILRGARKDKPIDFSETDGKKIFRINDVSGGSVPRNIFEVLGSVSSLLRWKKEEKALSSNESKLLQSIRNILQSIRNIHPHFVYMGRKDMKRNYSFAPMRSKPQRTYDPLSEVISSDGADVPMMLGNMSRKDSKKWQQLRERLVEFGQSSELFTDIDVRNLGESMGDPFQLQFKVRKQEGNMNMIDIGYGISQILPILARLLSAPRPVSFLMQQPEVHLHPRGQAELSSLLVNLMKDKHHNFIIETHSDAMIDRARIEIMKGNILPEDVSLIYLEPLDDSVDVYNITFDAQANFLGAPDGYRDFFLKESDRLLGFAED